MAYGTLYGVGVGPGASDLLTLRAVRVLRRAGVVVIPRRSETASSLAWRIAGPEVGEVPGQERLFLTFPMTKDPAVLAPAWDEVFLQVGRRLEAGLDVAFITEGDPLFFSTFVYLMEAAPSRWPEARVEVVPGVSSLTAAAAVAGIPLVDGQERMAVVPATYGVEDLAHVLEEFDTILLTKVSSHMAQVVEALERQGLLDRAVYVSRATMEGELVERDLRRVVQGRCDYFSMVVVSKKENNGLLLGQAAQRSVNDRSGGHSSRDQPAAGKLGGGMAGD